MAVKNHVENPFEFVLEKLGGAISDITHATLPNPARHASQATPVVRRITVRDVFAAVRQGFADLGALRDDILFIGLIYPLAGLVIARLAFSYDLLPLVFPLASGFAIVGPVVAVGLYELSRRRELGEEVRWRDAFRVLRSPALGSILGLGAILLALFGLWLVAANGLYMATLGPEAPASMAVFERNLFQSPQGAALIAGGIGVGFLFAATAFVIGVVTCPLLLDRDVGLRVAIGTSLKVVAANPVPMAVWGLIVAGGLVLGSAPGLVGLIVAVPVLGHATWHLYRKLVAPV